MYNFSVPASLKAYFDLIARVGKTFRYTETGPEGLLNVKKAYIAMATGGTPARSEADFASGYVRHFLSFLGIKEIELVYADLLAAGSPEEQIATAIKQIDSLDLATI